MNIIKGMKCPHCPYYEQKTSYGTELLECNNEECPYKAESEEMQGVVKRKAGIPREDYEPLYSCENWIP